MLAISGFLQVYQSMRRKRSLKFLTFPFLFLHHGLFSSSMVWLLVLVGDKDKAIFSLLLRPIHSTNSQFAEVEFALLIASLQIFPCLNSLDLAISKDCACCYSCWLTYSLVAIYMAWVKCVLEFVKNIPDTLLLSFIRFFLLELGVYWCGLDLFILLDVVLLWDSISNILEEFHNYYSSRSQYLR